MDAHSFVLGFLKLFVLFFSGIALAISLILVFSKDLFLKLSRRLSQECTPFSPAGAQSVSKSPEEARAKNIRTLGYLILFLSVISLYYIAKSFNIAVLTQIFSSGKVQAVFAEIALKFLKFFLLFSLSMCFCISFPMIISPVFFRKMDLFLQKKYTLGEQNTKADKVLDLEEVVALYHVPIGIIASLFSCYILFIAFAHFIKK